MTQCSAWTKHGTRCQNRVRQTRTCFTHRRYYTNWFQKHPPIVDWRSHPSEEYTFQIEHGYVSVSEEYVQSIRNGRLYNAYYEYLVQLPHIRWDCNLKVLVSLYIAFLRRTDGSEAHLDQFFQNMFHNPSFQPGTFLLRLILLIGIGTKQGFADFLTDDTIRTIYTSILSHPRFEGWMYTNWRDEFRNKTEESEHSAFFLRSCPLFLDILEKKRDAWFQETRTRCDTIRDELMVVAWHPTRVMDWCLYETQKHRWTRPTHIPHRTRSGNL